MIEALFNRKTFKEQPAEFRMGAVISDGMWYSLTKWRKIARVSEEEITDFIERYTREGKLVQGTTGEKSYRFPLKAIREWYAQQGYSLDQQLVDFLFPPRIWDELTETEGFLQAPLREIGILSFEASPRVAEQMVEALRGVARVREVKAGHYKAYCLDPYYAQSLIQEVVEKAEGQDVGKITCRGGHRTKRREMVDFSKEFANGLVLFYRGFGKTLVKRSMDTISIFLPEAEDQEAQVLLWVLAAIEKFDEAACVPFPGYLASVLNRWPYDLPHDHLGKELTTFQRQKARTLKTLREDAPRRDFSNSEIAEHMGLDSLSYSEMESKNKLWMATKHATTLNWEETNEEKATQKMVEGYHSNMSPTNIALSHKLSQAVIDSALATGLWEDAYALIGELDANSLDEKKLNKVSSTFVDALGGILGL